MRMEEHRIFSTLYEHVYSRIEPAVIRSRRALVAGGARGKVLEIGVGNGLNLPFYRLADEVWGVDPDPSMLEKVGSRVQSSPAPVKLVRAEAEELPFEAETFDTVVPGFLFCARSGQGVRGNFQGVEAGRRAAVSGACTIQGGCLGGGSGCAYSGLVPLSRRLSPKPGFAALFYRSRLSPGQTGILFRWNFPGCYGNCP